MAYPVINGTDSKDTISPGLSAEVFAKGGDDTIILNYYGVVHGESGNDVIDDFSDVGSSLLDGGEGDDTIFALGRAGYDTIIGGVGSDTIYSGGNPTIFFGRGDGSDTINTGRDVIIDGHHNAATVIFNSGVRLADVVMSSSGRRVVFSIRDTNDSMDFNFFVPESTVRFLGENISLSYADVYRIINAGTDASQLLSGSSTPDNISALGGADTILGLAGADTLNGGSGDDSLDGGADADLLIGDTGADTLIGGDGIDTLIGGMGSDTYVLTGDGDVVQEKPSEGYDTIQSSATATLADNFEKLVLTGAANANGTGNGAANELVGNDGINVLNGLGGADTLRGGAITAGRDSLYGGAGDDVYILSGNAQAIEQTGEGSDTVQLDYATGAAGYTLGENIEKGRILSTAGGVLYGNRGANSLNGASGNDALYGGIGVDRLYGGDGNDTLEGGAGTDFLVGGQGSDTYVYEYGDGFEVINSFAPDAANADKDTLIIKGLTQDQLWFERDAQDLVIRVVGDVTFVNVLNWFDGSNAQVDTIKLTETGKALTADKVAGLVSAMANFAPPALSANAIDAGVLTALAPVLTASWLDAA
jgi:Ca2+-binding RTX toxin-like protein